MHTDEGLASAALMPIEAGSFDREFQSRALEALGRLRQAMESVVFSVTRSLSNSRSLLNALGVDLNVSWQVYKLLSPVETLATVQYVPAEVSFKKLLAAAKKKGVGEKELAEASAAYAALGELIAETTGDREQFETAVMSYVDVAESAQIGLSHRKSVFRAHVHYFGMAVDVLAISLLYHPGEKADTFDFVGLRQMLGLKRLRAGTDVVVDRWKLMPKVEGDSGETKGMLLADVLDPEAAAAHDAAVLPEFCSKPILPMVTTVEPSGNVRTLLRHRDLGVGREVDVATGRVTRGLSLMQGAAKVYPFGGLVEIARPTRVQVVNVLVHHATWPRLQPRSGVFAHIPRRIPSLVAEEAVRLPFAEVMEFMGRGEDALRMADVPRNQQMVKHACARLGWRVEDFDVYQIRIDYPLMDSSILLQMEAGT